MRFLLKSRTTIKSLCFKRGARVRDWSPFVVLFFAYEAMYGFADNIAGIVHELKRVEMLIFGTIPTLVLQQFYRNPVLDYAGAFFYSLHFIVPATFGFIVWKYAPKNYWKYLFAFMLVSYGALITFMVYPTAPPLFGADATRILYEVGKETGAPSYGSVFAYFESNPFAAFPRLHSAYPWLVSLFAIKIKRIKALPILLIPIGIWFSAVYLGEHYVIDVLGGITYSTCAFFLAEKLVPRLSL